MHFVPRREGDGLQLPWTGQKKPREFERTELGDIRCLYCLGGLKWVANRRLGSFWKHVNPANSCNFPTPKEKHVDRGITFKERH